MNVIELFRKACLLMACMAIFVGVNAQTAPPSLDKQVRVPAKEMNIIMLGDFITAQTGFILSFNAQKIIAQKRLQLRHSCYSIRQLLSMIKAATNSEYAIYREHVIFHRVTNHAATVSTPGTNHTARGNVAHRHTPLLPKPPFNKTHLRPGVNADQQTAMPSSRSSGNSGSTYRGIIMADHIDKKTGPTAHKLSAITTEGSMGNKTANDSRPAYNRPYLISYLASAAIDVPVVKPATPVYLPVTSAVQPHERQYKREKPGLFKPFVLAGFGADEIFYANLQAKAGLTLIYGIADWSSNFSISGFRYGAGSSYPLRNGWLIQLEATTGRLSKETLIRRNDTAIAMIPLDVSSRLQRISLFAQKNIAQHLSVYGGPVFNHLKTIYQLTNTQVSLATVTLTTFAAEKDYTTVKPPYTLSSSAPTELENIKTWIGLQIGINYRF